MSNSLFGDIDLTEVIGNETIRQRFEAGSEQVTGEEVVGGDPPAVDGEPIEDWHDLDAVREDLNKDYVLVNDLNSNTDGYDEHVRDPEAGFDPIGEFDSNDDVEFAGTFDGNGNEIADVVIDRPTESSVGLFGANEGRIENVTLTNVSVTGGSDVGGLVGLSNDGEIASSSVEGDVAGDSYVGGLVGFSQFSEIESSTATGDIKTTDDAGGGLVGGEFDSKIESAVATGDVEGEVFVGGLIGLSENGEIESSAATGDVEGGTSIGGLVGSNSDIRIESSAATGDVEGESLVGGLVGSNFNSKTESVAATGDVEGDSDVGGLVGSNTGEIASSFATGAVDGGSEVGGVVGENGDFGTVMDTYWDENATGQQHGIGDGQGGTTGLDTDEMQGETAPENMDDLDFEDTWEAVVSGESIPPDEDGYPILQAIDAEPQLEAQGLIDG